MFRRFRRRKAEEEISPEEIEEEMDKLRGKIPSFILRDIGSSLKGKSVTREKFDRIIETLLERVDQTRIDKKIGNMAEELTRLSRGVETLRNITGTSEEATEEFPLKSIEGIERKTNDFSEKVDEGVSSNKELESVLTSRLDEIEKETFEEVPIEKLERLEKEVSNISSGIDDLSGDMCTILGGLDINELVVLGLKGKLT